MKFTTKTPSLLHPLLKGAMMVGITVLGTGSALGEAVTSPSDAAVKNGTLAYVLTHLHWAVYQSPDSKTECPNGFNEGNREQFKKLFPSDGRTRTLQETQLQWEIGSWYPTTTPDSFPFLEASGPVAYGMNLDGKAGPNDFTNPDGERGVDNQLYRVLGCIRNYRAPEGAIQGFDDDEVTKDGYNRVVIEITGVDNLANDNDVDVTVYRGRDPLLLDATGKNAIPGGSQRIDTRWGAKFIQHLHGKVVDGVLVTEPHDLLYPWDVFNVPTDEFMRGARLRLKLSPTAADGMIAGYTDVESWYSQLMRSYSTHHQSYGQSSAPSIYKELRRLADAYPDPQSGANTAISSALLAQFTLVNIVASSRPASASLPARHPEPYAGPPYQRAPAKQSGSDPEVAKTGATAGR